MVYEETKIPSTKPNYKHDTIIGMTSDKTGNTKMDNDNAPLNESTVVIALTKSEQINVNSQKLLFITASH